MKKEIIKDPFFLSQKATPANPMTDKQVIIDLQDTLRANRDCCVGLAANMIGSHKAIIIVAAGPFDIVMVNPVMTKKISTLSNRRRLPLSYRNEGDYSLSKNRSSLSRCYGETSYRDIYRVYCSSHST